MCGSASNVSTSIVLFLDQTVIETSFINANEIILGVHLNFRIFFKKIPSEGVGEGFKTLLAFFATLSSDQQLKSSLKNGSRIAAVLASEEEHLRRELKTSIYIKIII